MGNRYLIFLGCAIPYRVSAYEISARKVLAKLGVELVEMPEFNCCGLPLDPVSHETMLILGSVALAIRLGDSFAGEKEMLFCVCLDKVACCDYAYHLPSACDG